MQGKYHGLFLLTVLYIRRPHVAVHDWDFPSTQKQWIRWPKLSLPADVLWGSFVTHSFLLFPFGVRFTHINSPWLADHDTITNRILAYSNNPERKCRLFLADVILGDPGAVSRAGRKGATKVFKLRRKSPWVPTLTGPFPDGQVNAGSWLGTKNALYYCANRGTASPEFFSWVRIRRDSYWLDHGLSGSCTKQMHAVRKLSFDINTLFQNTGCLYTRLLSKT